MLANIYDWVIRAIFSAAAGILGGVAVILPPAVREHFFSSRQRIVAFVFLMLVVNGIVKLVLSAFMSVIELFGVTGNFSFDITNLLPFTNPYVKGYDDGYNDGRYYKDSKLGLLSHKSIWLRLWNFIKYGLVCLVFYSVIMTSDW